MVGFKIEHCNFGCFRLEVNKLLSFVASFLTFTAIGGFPSFVEDMKVFERERLKGIMVLLRLLLATQSLLCHT